MFCFDKKGDIKYEYITLLSWPSSGLNFIFKYRGPDSKIKKFSSCFFHYKTSKLTLNKYCDKSICRTNESDNQCHCFKFSCEVLMAGSWGLNGTVGQQQKPGRQDGSTADGLQSSVRFIISFCLITIPSQTTFQRRPVLARRRCICVTQLADWRRREERHGDGPLSCWTKLWGGGTSRVLHS